MLPSGLFDPRGFDDGIGRFYRILGNHVEGKVSACARCCDEMTARPSIPITDAMRVAYFVSEGQPKKTKYLRAEAHGVKEDGWYRFP